MESGAKHPHLAANNRAVSVSRRRPRKPSYQTCRCGLETNCSMQPIYNRFQYARSVASTHIDFKGDAWDRHRSLGEGHRHPRIAFNQM